VRRASRLKVPGIGSPYADAIQAWQGRADFGPEARLVGDMIQQDAAPILGLKQQIKALQDAMARIAESSRIARQRFSMPGHGHICSAELAGEIGTVERFRNEASLALYLGMATLDHGSGKSRGSKPPRHVNTRGPRRR
jgi:transposase